MGTEREKGKMDKNGKKKEVLIVLCQLCVFETEKAPAHVQFPTLSLSVVASLLSHFPGSASSLLIVYHIVLSLMGSRSAHHLSFSLASFVTFDTSEVASFASVASPLSVHDS